VEESVSAPDPKPGRGLGSEFVYWPLCLIGVALVALAVLGPEVERRLLLDRQIAGMQAEVDALQHTRDQLAAAEEALKGDPEYRERIVRHEFGITRPGEIRLPQPVTSESLRAGAARPAMAPVPEWMRIVAWFSDPSTRLLALASGGTMLLAGILFSLPTRARKAKAVVEVAAPPNA